MNTLKYKRSYRRKLPHIQPPGATFFITSRLAGSIPREVWLELRARLDTIYAEIDDEGTDAQTTVLKRERIWFQEYEQYLHETKDGPYWLEEDRLAVIVAETLHHFDQLDQRRYRLDAFCVMSNHIHVVLMPLPTTEPTIEAHINGKLVKDREGNIGYLDQDRQFVPVTFHSLASIMHSVKRQTANQCNKLLNRTGSFWEPESYDRYVRDHEEWRRMVNYTLNNPVKARLVDEWSQWPWSWHRANV
jgi:putative transposase